MTEDVKRQKVAWANAGSMRILRLFRIFTKFAVSINPVSPPQHNYPEQNIVDTHSDASFCRLNLTTANPTACRLRAVHGSDGQKHSTLMGDAGTDIVFWCRLQLLPCLGCHAHVSPYPSHSRSSNVFSCLPGALPPHLYQRPSGWHSSDSRVAPSPRRARYVSNSIAQSKWFRSPKRGRVS